MTFAANDLRVIIQNDWNLGGELSKTASDTMKETVKFFSRPQVQGNEKTKAVEVVKDSALTNEGVTEHPKFVEFRDRFQINIRYRVTDDQESTYNKALTNVELMEEEVISIIETVFSPKTNTGTFFNLNRDWQIMDNFNAGQIEVYRRMTLTLYQIQSRTPEGFRGFGGVLALTPGLTEADNKPGSDYVFTEVYEVTHSEGWEQVPELTSDQTLGEGVPYLIRGAFSGQFQATMYAKASDFEGGNINALDNIYKTQDQAFVAGEQARVVFLHAHTNTEPRTLTVTTFIKPTRIERRISQEGLITYVLRGAVERPSTWDLA